MAIVDVSRPPKNLASSSSNSKLSESKQKSPDVQIVKKASPVANEEADDRNVFPFPNMPRLWQKVEINLENSLLCEEKLNCPPSLSDGMSSEVEQELRYLGCELIQSASILLQLPQVNFFITV